MEFSHQWVGVLLLREIRNLLRGDLDPTFAKVPPQNLRFEHMLDTVTMRVNQQARAIDDRILSRKPDDPEEDIP